MKSAILRLSSIICLLLLIVTNPVLSAQDRRIALVIGNGAYKISPLKNPVYDANDIADALKRLGFSVTLKTNAIQRTMEESIQAFGSQLRSGGVGLFYFAGHGITVKGRNYLIPIDADIRGESDVKYESVDAGRVLGKMEDAGNNLNIIILDACRDNPFGRSFRSSDRGLAKMNAPTGSILAYATAPGSVASDGPGRNGLYTSALLKHMITPGIPIEKMFKRIRIDVVRASGKKQVPWESSSLTGDFFFNADRGITAVKHPKPESSKLPQGFTDKELLFWQSIQNSDDPDEYKAYLIEFPNGKFVSLANIKIRKLQQKKMITSITPVPKAAEIEKPGEKTVVASISPDDTMPKIIARDGPFIKYDNGVVHNTRTDLQWYAGPDKDTTWNKAKSWVANLTVDGGGWRMPTRRDLKSLYKKGAGSRNMTSLLKTTGWWVWSRETRQSSSAWHFFFFGGYESWRYRDSSYNGRGFAVRSKRSKKKAYDFVTNEPNR